MVYPRCTTTTTILLASTLLVAEAFSHPMASRTTLCQSNISSFFSKPLGIRPCAGPYPFDLLTDLRGGATDLEVDATTASTHPNSIQNDESDTLKNRFQHQQQHQQFLERTVPRTTPINKVKELLVTASVVPMGAVSKFGASYAMCLQQRPILTKSATAGIIFALSDLFAQRLEKRDEHAKPASHRPIVWSRILSSAAVGFFYFGPAAHYWYDMIFRILPSTSLGSTIQKAALGQLFFGPTFTCIFFATGLMQLGQFSFPNWWRKIRSDLPGAWLAGAGFWPLVDLVSFSLIQPQFIPLFVNLCSLVWTTYLVLKSYS